MKSYTYKDNCENPKTLVVFSDRSKAIYDGFCYHLSGRADIVAMKMGDYTYDKALSMLDYM